MTPLSTWRMRIFILTYVLTVEYRFHCNSIFFRKKREYSLIHVLSPLLQTPILNGVGRKKKKKKDKPQLLDLS